MTADLRIQYISIHICIDIYRHERKKTVAASFDSHVVLTTIAFRFREHQHLGTGYLGKCDGATWIDLCASGVRLGGTSDKLRISLRAL